MYVYDKGVDIDDASRVAWPDVIDVPSLIAAIEKLCHCEIGDRRDRHVLISGDQVAEFPYYVISFQIGLPFEHAEALLCKAVYGAVLDWNGPQHLTQDRRRLFWRKVEKIQLEEYVHHSGFNFEHGGINPVGEYKSLRIRARIAMDDPRGKLSQVTMEGCEPHSIGVEFLQDIGWYAREPIGEATA
jgi:hypothetical protein